MQLHGFSKNIEKLPGLPCHVAVPAPLVELGRAAEAAGSAGLLCIVEGYLTAPSANNVHSLLALTL